MKTRRTNAPMRTVSEPSRSATPQRTEQELRRIEFYLSEGQRLAHTGSWAFERSRVFNYWSPELYRIYGADPTLGPPTLADYLAMIHPDDRDYMAETIERMLADRSGCDLKKRIVRPGGEIRYIRCVGAPVLDNGIFDGFVGTAMDVTEEEERSRELRRRQAYLVEAQRLSQTGSFSWSVETGELDWSEEMFRIFELDRSTKPTLERFLELVHPDDQALMSALIPWASAAGRRFEVEHRLSLPGGSVKTVHVVAHASQGEAGDTEYLGAVMDVTRNRKARADLREAFKEIETQARALLEERIHERERIARELHDTLLQSVQGLILKFQAVANRIPHDASVRHVIEETLDDADRVVAEGRLRIRDLRCGNPSGNDLPGCIERLVEEQARDAAAAIGLQVKGAPRELHALIVEDASSILREALRNALRHSGASHVGITIRYEPERLRVSVHDDGRGVAPGVLENGGCDDHWGLRGMRERAQRIGGSLDIRSRSGEGTEVELSLPSSAAYRAHS